jgi:hypothetical protein
MIAILLFVCQTIFPAVEETPFRLIVKLKKDQI